MEYDVKKMIVYVWTDRVDCMHAYSSVHHHHKSRCATGGGAGCWMDTLPLGRAVHPSSVLHYITTSGQLNIANPRGGGRANSKPICF